MKSPLGAAGIALLLIVVPGLALRAVQPPETDQVEVDALQCWRDLHSGAVQVGKSFTMTVTCSVVESDTAITVLDETSLAPETIDLAPFDVIEGQRFADLHDGLWRSFQYRYTVRVLDRDLIGQDVNIPALELSYYIERTLGGGTALPGREHRYVLPPEPIRVLSLVPQDASDIQGIPSPSFGDADRRQLRSTLALFAAAALGVAALGFLVAAAAGVGREWRRSAPATRLAVPDSVVAARALTELTTVQRSSQDEGWNDDLVSRALTAFRLAGAVALSTTVAEEVIGGPGRADRDGQLSVRRGSWRPTMTTLSSSVTSSAIADEITRRRAHRPDDSSPDALGVLQNALRLFTIARYSQVGRIPTDELTGELDRGIGAVQQLRLRTRRPVRLVTTLFATARDWWDNRWAR